MAQKANSTFYYSLSEINENNCSPSNPLTSSTPKKTSPGSNLSSIFTDDESEIALSASKKSESMEKKVSFAKNEIDQESGIVQKPQDNEDEVNVVGDYETAGSESHLFKVIKISHSKQIPDQIKEVREALKSLNARRATHPSYATSLPDMPTKSRKSMIPVRSTANCSTNKNQKFICQYCDRIFERELALKNHQTSYCTKIPDKDKRKLLINDYKDTKVRELKK